MVKRSLDGSHAPNWDNSLAGLDLMSNVGLIRNVNTGAASSQFHVVFDEHFTTLQVNSIPDAESIPSEWVNLFISN
jgi:hypothetical protein